MGLHDVSLGAGAGVGLITCIGAGCVNELEGSPEHKHDDHVMLEFEGEGRGAPIALIAVANDVVIDETLFPGDERDVKKGDHDRGRLEISIDYEEDEFEVDLEWRIGELSVEFEVEQEVWQRTTAELGFTVIGDRLISGGHVEVELPSAVTRVTMEDQRSTGSWEYELDVEVEDDGEETEIEWEIEKD